MLQRKKFDYTVLIIIVATLAALWVVSIQTIGTPSLGLPNAFESTAAVSEVGKTQPWRGEQVREASLNWADYAGTPARPWNGEQIREASRNYADYVEVTQPETVFPRPFMGRKIKEASLNWADYGETAESDATPHMGNRLFEASLNYADYAKPLRSVFLQSWMGRQVREASLNYADYAETTDAVAASPQLGMGKHIREASLNWADDFEAATPEPGSSEPMISTVDAAGPF